MQPWNLLRVFRWVYTKYSERILVFIFRVQEETLFSKLDRINSFIRKVTVNLPRHTAPFQRRSKSPFWVCENLKNLRKYSGNYLINLIVQNSLKLCSLPLSQNIVTSPCFSQINPLHILFTVRQWRVREVFYPQVGGHLFFNDPFIAFRHLRQSYMINTACVWNAKNCEFGKYGRGDMCEVGILRRNGGGGVRSHIMCKIWCCMPMTAHFRLCWTYMR